MSKSKEMKRVMRELFPVQETRKDCGLCPICGNPIGEFRDELSKREFEISGMCQNCQDSIFGGSRL